METKEIIEGNKLIAEFMKVSVSDYTSYEEEGRKCYTENDLEYHSSWDWLMPVVEKCLIGEAECNEPVLITNIYDALTSISITGTFVAVVEYIKWYNNQIE